MGGDGRLFHILPRQAENKGNGPQARHKCKRTFTVLYMACLDVPLPYALTPIIHAYIPHLPLPFQCPPAVLNLGLHHGGSKNNG